MVLERELKWVVEMFMEKRRGLRDIYNEKEKWIRELGEKVVEL